MDNPVKSYYENGNIRRELWSKNGLLHRLNGPAAISYHENRNIKSEHWFKNDQRYRIDGPADIWYDENGKIEGEHWWINDKEINKPYDNYPLTKEQIIEMKLTYG